MRRPSQAAYATDHDWAQARAGSGRPMENKTKATPQKEEALQKDPEIPDAVLPLLDLSDTAVTKLINEATKRSYVSYN
jgi:hypothetical protein